MNSGVHGFYSSLRPNGFVVRRSFFVIDLGWGFERRKQIQIPVVSHSEVFVIVIEKIRLLLGRSEAFWG